MVDKQDSWSLDSCIKYAGRGYFIRDIDTLRMKLIEDMEDAWRKLCASDDKMKYRFINAWRNSINKRFGVDADGN